MPRINRERLLSDQRRLAEFGKFKTGVNRPTFSPEDIASRHWLADRLTATGLDTVIDGVGNVIGRTRAAGPKLLIGSHIESQKHAGWLDGAYGVICGLEVARAFAEDPACAGIGVDVAAWADEENHYLSFLGSRSFTDTLAEDEIDQAANRDDRTPLRDALRAAGLAGRGRERIEAGRHVGYLEAHVEQGDYLDTEGLRLGVVTSIVGIWTYRITFQGLQNHAGTTRMSIRKDAAVALVKLSSEIEQRFSAAAGERTVWTTGRIVVEPGSPGIVPGFAEMLFQFRDADPAKLEQLEGILVELVDGANRTGPCKVELTARSKAAPVLMHPDFQAALETSADRHASHKHIRMPSAAGHDAQVIAKRLPAGMLFVPSIGGVSHHWSENTADEDLALGCQVLADAAEAILRRAQASPSLRSP